MDQESEGTSLVIFVVGGAVVLLLLLGGAALFLFIRVEHMPEAEAPVLEGPGRVEVREDPPVHAEDQSIQPKVAPINEPPGKLETLPVAPKEKQNPHPPK